VCCSEAEVSLERGHRLAAPIVAKDQFVEIDLQLIRTDAVMGSDHCCRFPFARSAKGTGDFAPLRSLIARG
jgi:hypothetical protein